jgi:hypothetical protein
MLMLIGEGPKVIASKITVSTVACDFREYETVNLRVQYTEDNTGANEIELSKLFKFQTSAMLSQIENKHLHDDHVIGDNDDRYECSFPHAKYKKMKMEINKEIEEKQAIADANVMISVKVAGNLLICNEYFSV